LGFAQRMGLEPDELGMMPFVVDGVEYNEIYACPVHEEFARNPRGATAFVVDELWVEGPNGRVRFA
jgi:hypothetical protein